MTVEYDTYIAMGIQFFVKFDELSFIFLSAMFMSEVTEGQTCHHFVLLV